MFRRSWGLVLSFAPILAPPSTFAQQKEQTSQDLSALWHQLADADGEKAFRAMRRLATTPDDTVRFLTTMLPPATRAATVQQIETLIRQLDSERFAERNKAQQELERLDWQALEALRKAAQTGGTLEHTRRLTQLIGRIEGPLSGAKLRDYRAVEVVEWIRTPAAKALLERWGRGERQSPLTQEASKSLKRHAAWREPVRVPETGWPKADALGDPLPRGVVLRIGSTRSRMGAALFGESLFFTSDGKRLIGVEGAVLCVMDGQDGKILLRKETDRSGGWRASTARLTPDRKRLVASGYSRLGENLVTSLRVWDVDGFKEIGEWPVEGTVLGFAETSDVVFLGTPKGIQQFDLKAGRPMEFFPLPKDARGVVALHKTTVVARSREERFLLYDLAAPDKVRTLELFGRPSLPWSHAISPDGKILAWGDLQSGLILCDVKSGKPIRQIVPKGAGGGTVRGPVFSPDGKTLIFTSGSGDRIQLVAWDMEQHQARWKTEGGGRNLVFSPDGRFIAGQMGARIALWESATGKEITPQQQPAAAATHELAFASDGRSLLTVQGDVVRLWDFPGCKLLREFAHARVNKAVLSPDGRRLATSGFNHDLRLWDTSSGRELMKLPDGGWQEGTARHVIFSSDGHRLCTWEADFRLRTWDVKTGRLLAEHLPRPEGFPKGFDDANPRRLSNTAVLDELGYTFCFFPDGSRFLWLVNKLRSYDMVSGEETLRLGEPMPSGYYCPEISADLEWLLLGGGNQPETLINLRLQKKIGHVDLGKGNRTNAAAISPDARCFALEVVSGASRKILLYETATLRPRLAIPLEYASMTKGGHVHSRRLDFSPDARFLGFVHTDGTVLIWDLRSLEL